MKKLRKNPLILGDAGTLRRTVGAKLGGAVLFAITAVPTLAIVFMIIFITAEALPFFENFGNVAEFFTSTNWSPSDSSNPHFGALSIFYGTAMVTTVSCAIAVPLGVLVAVCLSEIVSEKMSKIFKPVVELLAAIPSVVYGFFAIVIFAPFLQEHGGALVCAAILAAGLPAAAIASVCSGETFSAKHGGSKKMSFALSALLFAVSAAAIVFLADMALDIKISSGTNAFNASVILAIMALPTIVSISQDTLNSVGKDMREGSLALGATKTETIFKVVIPCAKSGIAVAVILGLMRVVGETMVVWMASGNSLKIPEPFFNIFEPVRTMTATIAGEMGEADQSTGSARYHVLFAMSVCLLFAALAMNAAGRYIATKNKA